MSDPSIITGIVDIHHNDRGYSLARAKSGGVVALLHKATEGGDWRDPKFMEAMTLAKVNGLLRGSYHFANDTDPIRQADHYITVTEPYPDALRALDLEEMPDGSKFKPMSTEGACAFVKRVHDRTGRWPLFYTFESRLWSMMRAATSEQRAVLARCPLWIAKHGEAPKPLPSTWNAWVDYFLWQYTSTERNGPADQQTYPRSTVGFDRPNQDRNAFRGTLDELMVAWKTVGIAP